MSAPQLSHTPEQLLEIGRKAANVDDMRKVGLVCFKPWVDAFKAGTSKQAIGNWLKRKGYRDVFDELSKDGLVKGENSLGGQYHVFHECIYDLGIIKASSEADSPSHGAADRKHLGNTAPIDVPQFTAVAIQLLQSSDPVDAALGIMACTGRRGIEVVVSGIFADEKDPEETYLNDVNPDYVYRFKNPAKKHNNDTDIEERPEFPTTSLVMSSDLLNAYKSMKRSAEVKELLTELKAYKNEVKRNDRFNDLWQHKLAACMSDNFGFLPGKLQDDGSRKPATPQDLRPAYAEITAWRDLERDGMGQVIKGSDILYKAQILGHYIKGSKKSETLKSLRSTLSYYGYRVSEKPGYPSKVFDEPAPMRCYESDRAWLNSLCPEKNQQDTFRYLRNKHESLEAENLELREKLRKLSQGQPLPAEQSLVPSKAEETIKQSSPPVETAPPDLAAVLQQVTARLEALEGRSAEDKVDVPTVAPVVAPEFAAELDNSPRLTNRQMQAFQWLDIVAAHIKDHNLKHDGDIWQMWAYSPRLLKDISKVSQGLVKEYWAQNEAELLALNEQWNLDNQHNRRMGMKKHSPTDTFSLERPVAMGGRSS